MSPEDAIQLLECHFLDDRAKRVNDEVWLELTFKFVKSKRIMLNKEVSHESVLNDLLNQVSELADMRTGSGSEADVMAKTISAVREVDAFSHVCRNPPKGLQALNSALRSCALEADRATIRRSNNSSGYIGDSVPSNATNILDEQPADSFYVDRNLRRNDGDYSRRRTFKGYGAGPSMPVSTHRNPNKIRRRVPWNVCIVCNKKNCHSSNHREQGRRVFRNFSRAYFGEDADDEERQNDDDSGEESVHSDGESFIAFARATVAMGISHRINACIMDAALIDTGSSILSTVGNELLHATRMASVRSTKPILGSKPDEVLFPVWRTRICGHSTCYTR